MAKVVDAVAEEIFKSDLKTSANDLVKVAETAWTGEKSESGKVFLTFLCDLSCEAAKDIYRCRDAEQNPPWLPQLPLAKERMGLPRSAEALSRQIRNEVLTLLGHRKRAAKEDLVVRWSQKKRDRVDAILVRELHAEEAGWTDYSADEAAVKDQVADAIARMLVEDTAEELARLWERKKHS